MCWCECETVTLICVVCMCDDTYVVATSSSNTGKKKQTRLPSFTSRRGGRWYLLPMWPLWCLDSQYVHMYTCKQSKQSKWCNPEGTIDYLNLIDIHWYSTGFGVPGSDGPRLLPYSAISSDDLHTVIRFVRVHRHSMAFFHLFEFNSHLIDRDMVLEWVRC